MNCWLLTLAKPVFVAWPAFSPSVPLWVEGPSSYVSSYNRRFTQSSPSHGRNTHTGTDQERLLELNEAFEIWKWGCGWVTPLVVYGMQGKQVERVFYVPCLCPPSGGSPRLQGCSVTPTHAVLYRCLIILNFIEQQSTLFSRQVFSLVSPSS